MPEKFNKGYEREDSLIATARRRRRRLIPVVLVTVVAANALMFLTLRSDAFKSWRANRLAKSAMEEIAKGDYQTAAGQTISALQLSPKDPEVIRATALLNLKVGSPQADPFYNTLFASGGWKPEDIPDAQEAALTSGDLRFFQKLQDMLPANLRGTARYSALLSSYYMAAGNFPAALQEAQDAAKRDPANTEYAIALAQLLLASGSPGAVAQASDELDRIASGKKPGEARKALLILMQSARIPPAARLGYALRLAGMHGAGMDDKFAAASLRVELDPSCRAAVTDELIAKYSGNDPEKLKALGAWLVHNGEPARAEALFPLQKALGRKDYFLIWLDAVAGQGRWEDVQAVLRSSNIPLEAPYMFLYRGRAAAQLGDDFAARQNFGNAIDSATGDVSALIYLAAYFRVMGLLPEEVRCLRKMAEIPSASRYAYEGLLNLYQGRKDTGEVLKTLSEMAVRWPKDPAVQNDVTYINLLLGEDLSTCLNDAQHRHETSPNLLPYSITYALALLENGEPGKALDLFRKSNVPIGNLLPWQRAVFAAILAGNGYGPAATDVALTIPGDALSAEEKAFLTRYLAAAKH